MCYCKYGFLFAIAWIAIISSTNSNQILSRRLLKHRRSVLSQLGTLPINLKAVTRRNKLRNSRNDGARSRGRLAIREDSSNIYIGRTGRPRDRHVKKIKSKVNMSTGEISFDMNFFNNLDSSIRVRRLEIYLTLRAIKSQTEPTMRPRDIGVYLLDLGQNVTLIKTGKFMKNSLNNRRHKSTHPKKILYNYVFELTSLIPTFHKINLSERGGEQNYSFTFPPFGMATNCRRNNRILPCENYDVFIHENPYLIIQFSQR